MFRNNPAGSSFSVDDIDKAMDFYGRTLGLEVKKTDMGFMDLKLGGSGATVMVYPKDDHQPATFTVLNIFVKDLDTTVDDLVAAGVQMEHYDQPMIKTDERGIARDTNGAIAWFKDPAGNVLAVLETGA